MTVVWAFSKGRPYFCTPSGACGRLGKCHVVKQSRHTVLSLWPINTQTSCSLQSVNMQIVHPWNRITMNSISKAEVNKRRQYFIADICSKIDKFCELGTRHHPKSPSCEPFNPNGHDGFTKHGGFNLCVFIKFKIFPPEKWVVRVPFPDSPWVTERMSSEIATMRYVVDILRHSSWQVEQVCCHQDYYSGTTGICLLSQRR